MFEKPNVTVSYVDKDTVLLKILPMEPTAQPGPTTPIIGTIPITQNQREALAKRLASARESLKILDTAIEKLTTMQQSGRIAVQVVDMDTYVMMMKSSQANLQSLRGVVDFFATL